MATTTLSNGFISLNDIINNFIISYTGPGKLIPDSKRTEVVFHARRCLQEFAYETLKSQFTRRDHCRTYSGVTSCVKDCSERQLWLLSVLKEGHDRWF